jgi:hypothetical protein
MTAILVPLNAQSSTNQFNASAAIKRVLLISIDGMHALDYRNCSTGIPQIKFGQPYCPNLAQLGQHGTFYPNASASKPSDSFPGLTAIVSGGSSLSHGAWYDVAYDRVLAPPKVTTWNGLQAGKCTPGKLSGTTTEYEEGIDIALTLNGGAPTGDGGINSIDPNRLVRDPRKNCAPVYPWNFVRTNTIFGVIHSAGGRTAWSDKHPSYSSVAGPGDGSNLDDYYSPEINSPVVALPGVTTPLGISCAAVRDPSQTGAWTDSFENIQCYDSLKVNGILHQIRGKTHDGKKDAPVPNIFGMNFQVVSVGQKLIEPNVGSGGYLDAAGTPSALLLGEIEFVDTAIGQFIGALKSQGLYESTVIVIVSKHGQSPIDPKRFFPIPGPSGTNGKSPATIIDSLLPASEAPSGGGIGPTEDDVSLLWLADQKQTGNAVNMLQAHAAAAGIGEIFYGPAVTTMYNHPGLPPTGDPRTPDIIVAPNVGVVYTGSSKKQEEHGGFSHDDTNVLVLVSNPSFAPQWLSTHVETMQVAPTVLKVLGLNPQSLDSVRLEGTQVLPGLGF